jgi:hypothetical protein
MMIAVTIRKEIPQPQCPVAKSQILKAKADTARAIRSINPVIFFIFNFPSLPVHPLGGRRDEGRVIIFSKF